ncbi:MAG TPA: GH92 family glycosyl hydrolase, partial [Magnetospirillaceae bacterium]|nr:GH92 family glycosyl hydrolase [Magnetospirillaceae bacterium]
MKWSMGLLGLAALLVTLPAVAAEPGYNDVDVFIGTGPDGHTFPGATVPFGMVQLSPDSWIGYFKQSYSHAAGYRYDDSTIQGFSHTHFSGAGHSDLGDVLVMPVSGSEVKLEPGETDKPGSGYRSRFSHADEIGQPGYYAVTLSDYGIRAELTATARVGLHRYAFPKGKPAHLLIDLRQSIYNYPGKVLWSRLHLRPDGTLTGFRETRGWAPDRKLFFAMRFSQAPTAHEFYNREDPPSVYKGFKGPGEGPDVPQIEGRGLIGQIDFGALATPLGVKVAISSVSEDGAIANLDAEAPAFDFDGARAAAKHAWEDALGSVRFEAPEPMRKNLYTSLYHALLAPSLAADVDGRYRGPDNEVHQAKGFNFVSSFSLWDTYRAEQPLMTLIQPESRTADVVNSLVASQEESPFGILPVWQFQGQETWCMIGYHAVPEIADAIVKGVKGFDTAKAMKAMVASATYAPYGHLGDYMKLGYVPVDQDGEAVSKTVEYAFDDWTIARAAKTL